MRRTSADSSIPHSEARGALEALDLQKAYETPQGRLAVLGGVSFHLVPGRIVALVGPNAVGKSTLLRLLARLDRPNAGEVRWYPSRWSRPFIAVQLQEVDDTLLPWRSNLRNATFGLEARGVDALEATEIVRAFVKDHVVPVPLYKTPTTSSGGERQMVAVLRAITVRPEVLLLDEPFSRIDPTLVTKWWGFLRQTVGEEQIACFVVTHNVVEAAALADEVLVLSPSRLGIGAVIGERIEAPQPAPLAGGDGQVLGRLASPEFTQAISDALKHSYGA